jgi:hypothetical protein
VKPNAIVEKLDEFYKNFDEQFLPPKTLVKMTKKSKMIQALFAKSTIRSTFPNCFSRRSTLSWLFVIAFLD